MPMPEMQDVNSSSIASVGYDAESHTVYVQFLDGSRAARPPRKSCWPATGKPPAWSRTTRRARPPNAGPSESICSRGLLAS